MDIEEILESLAIAAFPAIALYCTALAILILLGIIPMAGPTLAFIGGVLVFALVAPIVIYKIAEFIKNLTINILLFGLFMIEYCGLDVSLNQYNGANYNLSPQNVTPASGNNTWTHMMYNINLEESDEESESDEENDDITTTMQTQQNTNGGYSARFISLPSLRRRRGKGKERESKRDSIEFDDGDGYDTLDEIDEYQSSSEDIYTSDDDCPYDDGYESPTERAWPGN